MYFETRSGGIVGPSGRFIPKGLRNRDYQKYLAWRAVGNFPTRLESLGDMKRFRRQSLRDQARSLIETELNSDDAARSLLEVYEAIFLLVKQDEGPLSPARQARLDDIVARVHRLADIKTALDTAVDAVNAATTEAEVEAVILVAP